MYEQGDASVKASRFVRNLGFRLPSEPDFDIPVLPADITAVGDQDLMGLFTEILSWLDYTEVYLVSAQIDEEQENLALRKLEAQEQIRNKGERTVAASKARAYESPDYVKQKDEAFKVFSRRKILEVVYNSLDRKKFLVSREITRRKYGNDS